jgi:hypothetical protein
LNVEDELRQLALQRENAFESALDALDLDPPDRLLRQMRAYLADREDHGRIKRFVEKSVLLSLLTDGVQELYCQPIQFTSGSSLDFRVRLKKQQTGWRITQFQFQDKGPTACFPVPPAHRRRQKGACTLPDHEPTPHLAAYL